MAWPLFSKLAHSKGFRGVVALALAHASTALAEEQLVKTSRFGEVRVLLPDADAKHFILFLGTSPQGVDRARTLAAQGAVVALIDVERYLEMLRKDEDDCLYLAGEFERLGQVLQSASKVERYLTPIIAGQGRGAAIAYVIAAESPNGFAQGIFYDFCPRIALPRSFCEQTEPQIDPSGMLSAAVNAKTPMLFVAGTECEEGLQKRFLQTLRGTSLVDDATVAVRLSTLEPAQSMLASTVADLPLIEIREGTGKVAHLVVILSGDGGWASIDKALGEYLADGETSVLGFDSLKYFWSKRDPAKAAADLERAITFYSRHWAVNSVTLVGYSYGGQVLPFLFNRLSPAVASKVDSLVLLNPGERTEFEIHFSDWISDDDEGGIEIKPEVERIRTVPVSCIYGEEEQQDSLCPLLSSRRVEVVKLPGGHHFDGDYAALAKVVLEHTKQSALP